MYKPVSKNYELTFVDYPGLEVVARSASIGQIRQAQNMSLSTQNDDPEKQLEAFRFFEKKLISWNLAHPEVENPLAGGICEFCDLKEDDPLPATLIGMQCIDLSMMIAIMVGWLQSVASVSLPKGQSSNSGGMSIPEDLGMKLEQLTNPMTLPTPNLS